MRRFSEVRAKICYAEYLDAACARCVHGGELDRWTHGNCADLDNYITGHYGEDQNGTVLYHRLPEVASIRFEESGNAIQKAFAHINYRDPCEQCGSFLVDEENEAVPVNGYNLVRSHVKRSTTRRAHESL